MTVKTSGGSTVKTVDIILEYLHTHETSYSVRVGQYQNAVQFTFSGNIFFPAEDQVFGNDRFESTRLAEDFVTTHPALIAWLGTLIDSDEPPVPREVWLTAIHATTSNKLFLEVSFE